MENNIEGSYGIIIQDMETVFDKTTRRELISRINLINENSVALWGKMNIYQMLTHKAMWQQVMLCKLKSKRVFLGRIFGKVALKNDAPLRKNTPTTPDVTAKEKSGDLEIQRKKWIDGIEEYTNFYDDEFKHSDHHLRQFGA